MVKSASCIALLSIAVSTAAIAERLNCPCKVVKVSDGDTVHVLDLVNTRIKIRLGGIDAPEKKQAYGRKSSKNLARYIAGQSVQVEYRKKDRYGRIIGKILKAGQDINLQQVKDGFAWHYQYYQKDQSPEDRLLYSAAEKEARKQQKGLWAAAATAPWDYRRSKRRKK